MKCVERILRNFVSCADSQSCEYFLEIEKPCFVTLWDGAITQKELIKVKMNLGYPSNMDIFILSNRALFRRSLDFKIRRKVHSILVLPRRDLYCIKHELSTWVLAPTSERCEKWLRFGKNVGKLSKLSKNGSFVRCCIFLGGWANKPTRLENVIRRSKDVLYLATTVLLGRSHSSTDCFIVVDMIFRDIVIGRRLCRKSIGWW